MRLVVGVRSQVVSFLREPVNLVLMAAVPLVVVHGFGAAMSSLPETPTMQAVPGDVGRMLGALFSTAFVAGILGLFQAIGAREADRRLVLAGYPASLLLAARLATILLLSVVVAGVSYATLSVSVSPEAPAVAFAVLVAGGLVYALLGVLVGAVVPREFEGSLVVVFVANMDAFLGSGMSKLDFGFREAFPLYLPNELFRSAVTDGSVSGDTAMGLAAYLAVLGVLVLLFFRRATGGGQGGWT